ncbi:uncharacterized protein LOC142319564 isoform X2 [Lycorma delicatula]|uniref:uncharacterized protein LOC142319564 isoform X2 n=1 Tax=Lycorma delicatula TaxID=130591 RepID=UPI003F517AC7
MSSARMVRGTKSRLVLYICAALVLCGATYLFHNSQNQLDEVRRAAATCSQQQESLSAQLQVIFEYKLRLEKSLQKEKAEHKETKDECQNRAQEEKLQREKETLESVKKYNALQQHYKLLQSNHKDLTEECDKLRKTKLETVEEVSKLEHKVQSLRQELQQVKEENNKTLQDNKLKYEALLHEKELLEKENARLKENSGPVSDRVNKLEMTNRQLETELTQMKNALEQCKAGIQSVKTYSNGDAKSKLAGEDIIAAVGAQDNANVAGAVAAEPPKALLTGSSTTPVINPDAVMDHDDPLKQGQKESVNKSSTSASLLNPNKPTQEAAAPLVVPDQSVGGSLDGQMGHQIENMHQLAPPESMQIQQHKPVGPMNPVQEDPGKLFVPAVEINGNRMSNENNLIEPHVMQDMNGAVEEMEDPQQRQDSEIPRPVRPHEYQGGDYDKEEDEEGEQMDYDAKQQQQQQPPQNHNSQIQSHHQHRQDGGGSIMVNPK